MKILFCDVVGIPCGPNSFAKDTVANKNSDDIDKQAEVRHLFLQYAKSVGCNYPVADVKAAIDEVYPEPFPRPSTAKAMATYTKLWHELDRLPYMTLPDQSTILQEFPFSRDKDFREKYGDMILYGNATANRVETMNVCLDEADKVSMLLNPQWRTAFDHILNRHEVLKKCSAQKKL